MVMGDVPGASPANSSTLIPVNGGGPGIVKIGYRR